MALGDVDALTSLGCFRGKNAAEVDLLTNAAVLLSGYLPCIKVTMPPLLMGAKRDSNRNVTMMPTGIFNGIPLCTV